MNMSDKNQSASARWLLPCLIMIITIAAVSVIASRHQASSDASVIPTSLMTSDEYQARIANPDKKFELVVRGGKLVSGPSEIRVKTGDSVNIRISTPDNELQAELDGYDIRTEATNIEGTEGGFVFVADHPGPFPFYAIEESPESETGNSAPPRKQLGVVIVE